MILPHSHMQFTEISIFYSYIECKCHLPIMEIQNHWIDKWPPMVLADPHTISSSHQLLMSLHWEVTKTKQTTIIRMYLATNWNKARPYVVELEKKKKITNAHSKLFYIVISLFQYCHVNVTDSLWQERLLSILNGSTSQYNSSK